MTSCLTITFTLTTANSDKNAPHGDLAEGVGGKLSHIICGVPARGIGFEWSEKYLRRGDDGLF